MKQQTVFQAELTLGLKNPKTGKPIDTTLTLDISGRSGTEAKNYLLFGRRFSDGDRVVQVLFSAPSQNLISRFSFLLSELDEGSRGFGLAASVVNVTTQELRKLIEDHNKPTTA